MRNRLLVAPGAMPLCVQVYVPAVVYVVAVTGPQRLPVNVVAVEVWQVMEVCEGEGQQLSRVSDMPWKSGFLTDVIVVVVETVASRGWLAVTVAVTVFVATVVVKVASAGALAVTWSERESANVQDRDE